MAIRFCKADKSIPERHARPHKCPQGAPQPLHPTFEDVGSASARQILVSWLCDHCTRMDRPNVDDETSSDGAASPADGYTCAQPMHSPRKCRCMVGDPRRHAA